MFSLGLKLYHVALGKRARDEDTDISAGARPKTNHTTSASELHDLPTPPSAPPTSSGDSSPADEAPADPAAAQEDGSPHAPAQAASSPVAASGILPGTLKTVAECYADETLEQADTTVYPPDETLNSKVSIWRGDITKLQVDAIVNAANKALLGGGGVDGAIHRAAGEGLYDECVFLDGAETGESKITGGHKLPAKHVIHTVGPIYSRQSQAGSERLLRACYRASLALAVSNGCRSIAFSGISTGVYGYPIDAATRVALDVTRKFLDSNDGPKLDHVIFTVFRQIDVDSYNEIISEYFPAAADAEEGSSEPGEVEKAAAIEEAEAEGAGVVEVSEEHKVNGVVPEDSVAP